MRRLRFKLVAAALSFTVGLAAYLSWAQFFIHPERHASAPASLPVVEEWHRLYEAAGMSGDPRMRREVFDMLLCADRAGVADARPVAVEDGVLCRRRDGSEHEWNGLAGEYGPFFAEVTGGHAAWALRNTEFVSGISPAERAKAYVLGHEAALRP